MAFDAPQRQSSDPGSVGEIVQYIKAYAEQETVGPITGAGRWIAMGAAGAITLGIGMFLVLLGVLRLFQTEFDPGRAWSWWPYLAVLVLTAGMAALAALRIQKTYLDKKDK